MLQCVIITHHQILVKFVSELCRLGNAMYNTSNVKLGKVTVKGASIFLLVAAALKVAFAFWVSPFLINWDPI